MVLATHLERSNTSTPTQSPRTASLEARPQYSLISYSMAGEPREHSSTFEVVSLTGRPSDFCDLNPSKIILLLTPVLVPDTTTTTTTKPMIDPAAQDPFEVFGKRLSKKHKRIRHVPYVATAGLNEMHYAFAREAGAIIYVTMSCVRTEPESVNLYLDQDRRMSRAERRGSLRPIIHLRYTKDPSLRADSPRDSLAEVVYPTEQEFDDAVKLLYAL